MSSTWKVVIAVVITAVIVGGGGYYYINNKATKEKEDLQSQIDELNQQIDDLTTGDATAADNEGGDSTVTTVTTESDWKEYANTEYGFALTFNDKWQGYTIQNSAVTKGSRGGDALAMYTVSVPTAEKSEFWTSPWSPFVIQVYTPVVWDAVAKLEGPKPTLIAKNSQYAVAYSSAQDVPPADGVAIGKDIKNVIATFRFTK